MYILCACVEYKKNVALIVCIHVCKYHNWSLIMSMCMHACAHSVWAYSCLCECMWVNVSFCTHTGFLVENITNIASKIITITVLETPSNYSNYNSFQSQKKTCWTCSGDSIFVNESLSAKWCCKNDMSQEKAEQMGMDQPHNHPHQARLKNLLAVPVPKPLVSTCCILLEGRMFKHICGEKKIWFCAVKYFPWQFIKQIYLSPLIVLKDLCFSFWKC